MAFQYEKNLAHQEAAIHAVIDALQGQNGLEPSLDIANTFRIDPQIFQQNMKAIQQANHTDGTGLSREFIIDIQMETGTGKTYTYTKTMYELHRTYGLYKFVVVVPTVSIKAGTENFLKSTALAQHFRLDFERQYEDTQIELYLVQSQKQKKSGTHLTEISRFAETRDKTKIHVLLINQGMVNSESMAGKTSDGSQLFANEYNTPFEAIAATAPVVIIDEPHKFDKANKTWGNIKKFQPLLILRYGATFKEYENLLYRLSAVQAFNDNLVKGVNVFVETLEGDDGTVIRLEASTKEQAEFSFGEKTVLLKHGDSLGRVHANLTGIVLEGAKSNEVLLSNGLTLKKGDFLNPFSYNNTVTDKMLRNAIRVHFDTEKALLTREVKIKPLTLFFIDDIKSYREGRGIDESLLTRFERFVQHEVKQRLEKETDPFYKDYLEKTLADISATHGGYFAQDNSESDEKIEQEIHEILHNKEGLLSLNNPRRFIFSKWTLREGWDNPNVFGICKLRSSGSEISKLQEVGRGLRLPVNEYMARVKDVSFYLNYFVDSREQDFVAKLVNEVNSQVLTQDIPTKLDDSLIAKIRQAYPTKSPREIRNESFNAKYVNDNDEFIDDDGQLSSLGFERLKACYPLAFTSHHSLQKNKIRSGDCISKQKVRMRQGKYGELKDLWERLNQKVILQYEIKTEDEFLELFQKYLKDDLRHFQQGGSRTVQSQLKVHNHALVATRRDSIETVDFEPIAMMSYATFLQRLSEKTLIQRSTLHRAFLSISHQMDIRSFLNPGTINGIAKNFNRWLLMNSFGEFTVGYQEVKSAIHPTKFTAENGDAITELDANIFDGQVDTDTQVLENFLFEQVFFNSELEKENMTGTEIDEVTVFTKIPKNSIKIPVAGGGTYSPDFAYIVKTQKGEILNLVIETKGVDGREDLRQEEDKKIKHAQQLFNQIAQETKVVFQTQFNGQKIAEIIRTALQNNP